jgi:holliday junction DNA helicase RuvB
MPSSEKMSNPLRPVTWSDFIGQRDTVERLQIMVGAALAQGRTLDHVLLTGPPGLGKTTLAGIVANALGVGLRTITSTAIPTPAHMVEWLIGNEGKVAFIDEIHRLDRATAETLLPAMEDYVVDATLDLGGESWSGRVTLQRYTLIGATTRAGSLLAPLRDRFGVVERLKPYSNLELEQIIARSARLLDLALTPEQVGEIALRSRGTPRVANRLVARVRDWFVHKGALDLERALDTFGADEFGLDETGRLILSALAEQSRPVGIATLAAFVDEDPDTLEPLEAHLLRMGLIERTPRGRMITEKGRTASLSSR